MMNTMPSIAGKYDFHNLLAAKVNQWVHKLKSSKQLFQIYLQEDACIYAYDIKSPCLCPPRSNVVKFIPPRVSSSEAIK